MLAIGESEASSSFPYETSNLLIGRGGSGAVYLARHSKTNAFLAVKRCYVRTGNETGGPFGHLEASPLNILKAKEYFNEEDMREASNMEVTASSVTGPASILGTVPVRCESESSLLHYIGPHPHIVKYMGSYVSRQKVSFFVMELMNSDIAREQNGGNTAIHTEDVCIAVALSVLSALQHIHRLRVAHRDVKPGNILLKTIEDNTHPGIAYLVKASLGDFSAAHIIEPPDHDGGNTSLCTRGTLNYKSPEQLLGRAVSDYRPCDLWALGCTLFELLTGAVAFSGSSELKVQLQICHLMGSCFADYPQQTGRPILFDGVQASPQFVDFLARLLTLDPEKRITAQEALRHPIFDNREGVQSPQTQPIAFPLHLVYYSIPDTISSRVQFRSIATSPKRQLRRERSSMEQQLGAAAGETAKDVDESFEGRLSLVGDLSFQSTVTSLHYSQILGGNHNNNNTTQEVLNSSIKPVFPSAISPSPLSSWCPHTNESVTRMSSDGDAGMARNAAVSSSRGSSGPSKSAAAVAVHVSGLNPPPPPPQPDAQRRHRHITSNNTYGAPSPPPPPPPPYARLVASEPRVASAWHDRSTSEDNQHHRRCRDGDGGGFRSSESPAHCCIRKMVFSESPVQSVGLQDHSSVWSCDLAGGVGVPVFSLQESEERTAQTSSSSTPRRSAGALLSVPAAGVPVVMNGKYSISSCRAPSPIAIVSPSRASHGIPSQCSTASCSPSSFLAATQSMGCEEKSHTMQSYQHHQQPPLPIPLSQAAAMMMMLPRHQQHPGGQGCTPTKQQQQQQQDGSFGNDASLLSPTHGSSGDGFFRSIGVPPLWFAGGGGEGAEHQQQQQQQQHAMARLLPPRLASHQRYSQHATALSSRSVAQHHNHNHNQQQQPRHHLQRLQYTASRSQRHCTPSTDPQPPRSARLHGVAAGRGVVTCCSGEATDSAKKRSRLEDDM